MFYAKHGVGKMISWRKVVQRRKFCGENVVEKRIFCGKDVVGMMGFLRKERGVDEDILMKNAEDRS